MLAIACHAKSTATNEWIVDSGCTSHLSHEIPGIAYAKGSGQNILIASGESIPVTGKGSVELKLMRDDRSIMHCTLGEVLHVPGLSQNLLSVRQVCASGKKVLFEKDKCTIFDSSTVYGRATVRDGLYRMDVASEPSVAKKPGARSRQRRLKRRQVEPETTPLQVEAGVGVDNEPVQDVDENEEKGRHPSPLAVNQHAAGTGGRPVSKTGAVLGDSGEAQCERFRTKTRRRVADAGDGRQPGRRSQRTRNRRLDPDPAYDEELDQALDEPANVALLGKVVSSTFEESDASTYEKELAMERLKYTQVQRELDTERDLRRKAELLLNETTKQLIDTRKLKKQASEVRMANYELQEQYDMLKLDVVELQVQLLNEWNVRQQILDSHKELKVELQTVIEQNNTRKQQIAEINRVLSEKVMQLEKANALVDVEPKTVQHKNQEENEYRLRMSTVD